MFSEFVDRADVGMVERGGGARLAAEALQRLRIAAQFFRQKLQGDARPSLRSSAR